jgi:hypothetical protein
MFGFETISDVSFSDFRAFADVTPVDNTPNEPGMRFTIPSAVFIFTSPIDQFSFTATDPDR